MTKKNERHSTLNDSQKEGCAFCLGTFKWTERCAIEYRFERVHNKSQKFEEELKRQRKKINVQ